MPVLIDKCYDFIIAMTLFCDSVFFQIVAGAHWGINRPLCEFKSCDNKNVIPCLEMPVKVEAEMESGETTLFHRYNVQTRKAANLAC